MHVEKKLILLKTFFAVSLLLLPSCDIRMKEAQLQGAAEEGNTSEVIRLLNEDVNVNWQNTYGAALHRAALYGHIPVAKLLIDNGANVDASIEATAFNVFKKGYLQTFSIKEGIEQAIGATPLHLAVYNNHSEMVKFLISKGADVNARFTLGSDWSPSYIRTTIQIAEERGNKQMIELLRGLDSGGIEEN
jgi:ankyrin repeat protein